MKVRRNDAPSSRRPWPCLLACLLALGVAPAWAVDWKDAKEREVVLFHPGQASWEWVMTAADHSGATKFRAGKNCRGCHEGEQADMGREIAAGGHKVEARPTGRPASARLYVRTVHDATRLYMQLRWKPAPATHTAKGVDAARITVMLDDGGLKESARAGCWASCHDDAVGMASAPAGGEITKYLGGSRLKLTRQGGGTALRPAGELQGLMASDAYLEYWQARLNPGKPAEALHGTILDHRAKDTGSGLEAQAEFVGGEWRVTLSRPLAAGPGRKALVPGKTYTLGFALHDDYAVHRFHQVSMEYTLQLDAGTTDFVAASR
jgi:cytochrome c-type protein NapC